MLQSLITQNALFKLSDIARREKLPFRLSTTKDFLIYTGPKNKVEDSVLDLYEIFYSEEPELAKNLDENFDSLIPAYWQHLDKLNKERRVQRKIGNIECDGCNFYPTEKAIEEIKAEKDFYADTAAYSSLLPEHNDLEEKLETIGCSTKTPSKVVAIIGAGVMIGAAATGAFLAKDVHADSPEKNPEKTGSRQSSEPLEITYLTNTPNIKESDPDWSPDGKNVAYVANGDLYIMSADGIDKFRLVDGENIKSPAWSPDGKKIAFFDGDNLRIIETFSKQIKTDKFVGEGKELDWGSNNKLLFDYGSAGHLRIADEQGNTLDEFYNKWYGDAKWSPNCSKIMFSAQDSNKVKQYYIMSADGQNSVQITNNNFGKEDPIWVDNNRIVTSYSKDGNPTDLYLTDKQGTNLIQLTDTSNLGEINSDLSKDGKIAFTSTADTNQDIAVIDISKYIDPVQKYAPTFILSKDERYLPTSPKKINTSGGTVGDDSLVFDNRESYDLYPSIFAINGEKPCILFQEPKTIGNFTYYTYWLYYANNSVKLDPHEHDAEKVVREVDDRTGKVVRQAVSFHVIGYKRTTDANKPILVEKDGHAMTFDEKDFSETGSAGFFTFKKDGKTLSPNDYELIPLEKIIDNYNLDTHDRYLSGPDDHAAGDINPGDGKLMWYFGDSAKVPWKQDIYTNPEKAWENSTLDEIIAFVGSPVTLEVKDSSGNMISDDLGVSSNEEATFIRQVQDNYSYYIIGKEKGTYNLTILKVGEDKTEKVNAINIPIKKGEVHKISIDWKGIAEDKDDAVSVTIGKNTYKTDSNITTEDLKESKDSDPWCFVAGGLTMLGTIGTSIGLYLKKKFGSKQKKSKSSKPESSPKKQPILIEKLHKKTGYLYEEDDSGTSDSEKLIEEE